MAASWYVPVASGGFAMPYATDDTIAAAASSQRGTRQAQLRAAATAIALILDEIGPAAGLILLNAALDAVTDRLQDSAAP
jgi:hypothetical protein